MTMIEVRVCGTCGFANTVNSLECEKCGADLAFVIPSSIRNDNHVETEAQPHVLSECWKLCSIDNDDVIEIEEDFLVGRDNEIYTKIFNKSNYISRKHARFHIIDGNLYVEDASTNGTFVNGIKLEKMVKARVNQGDKLAFADIEFIVKR